MNEEEKNIQRILMITDIVHANLVDISIPLSSIEQ